MSDVALGSSLMPALLKTTAVFTIFSIMNAPDAALEALTLA